MPPLQLRSAGLLLPRSFLEQPFHGTLCEPLASIERNERSSESLCPATFLESRANKPFEKIGNARRARIQRSG